ncbi:MAG TPA: HEPN domain-containing protein [Solirubrobacterales bacterium]|nr:HEPN domain-containing protein [Solirubrobacterales bacterium]
MEVKQRPYLEADGDEVDCAYFLNESEYASGFLRLPNPSDTGRVRFLEDVPDLARLQSEPSLDPIGVTLSDGKGGGIDACLLDSFVSSTRFSAPLQPQFPITLTVNSVVVGSSDPGRAYEEAKLRCPELVGFFAGPDLRPERAVELGSRGALRSAAETDALRLDLREGVEVDDGGSPEVRLRWYGELVLAGAPRPLAEWAGLLVEHLCLFAFLCDQPLRPGHIYADGNPDRVDFYASWPEPAAPGRTLPLALLPEIEDRVESIVTGWSALLEGAHDLVDHVVNFQLFREQGTWTDHLLSLSRCLELYFDYSSRFDSKYRPTAEHRILVDEVTDLLPPEFDEEHGEWIRGALFNANQKRLVAQVEAILAALGPNVLTACEVGEAIEFARRVKAARNHYTHPNGPPDDDVPDGRDLVIHMNKLWFVVRACILQELGLGSDEIATRLAQSARRYLLK